MVLDLASLANLGLPEILLWLLSFAVVYGVLSQVGEGIPKNREARAIIAFVAAFFVLFAAPAALILVLTKMSSSLILVVLGLLVLMVFIEVAGLTHRELHGFDKEGKPVVDEIKLFTKHSNILFIVFIIITILIFVGAGGLQLLGLKSMQFSQSSMMSIMFFVVIILAIMWMITEGSGKKKQ